METIIPEEILLDLLQKHETPFYFYSKEVLYRTIEDITNSFPIDGFQLLFATMANDNKEFLKFVNECGVGACVNSIRHLKLVKECGFPTENIQFTSTGLSLVDMQFLQSAEIAVNFDSIGQLETWFSLKDGLSAGIRINTSSLTRNTLANDRLGVDRHELKSAMDLAQKMKGRLAGIHVYLGTNYRTHNGMLPPLENFLDLASEISTLEYVNIGGGVGVNYCDNEEFNIWEYGFQVCNLIKKLRNKLNKNIKLIFEPGRRLAAPSGGFLTKVTDIKLLNNTRYVVVDASVAIFPRPFHHPESPHYAFAPFKSKTQALEDAVVVGKTTFSRDILSKIKLPINLQVGDAILFNYAGAYCDSMRSQFLGQYEPQNIFL